MIKSEESQVYCHLGLLGFGKGMKLIEEIYLKKGWNFIYNLDGNFINPIFNVRVHARVTI